LSASPLNTKGSYLPTVHVHRGFSPVPSSRSGSTPPLPENGYGPRGRPDRAQVARGTIALDSKLGETQFQPTNPHGKSQEEAPSQDEQAQAPQALEIKSPQEAYVAEVGPVAHPAARFD
jgi:hypothetical protein